MSLKQETVATYNRAAGHFIREFNSIGPRVSDIERTFSYLDKPNPKILELGCGNGRDAQEILKRTADYLGIDASEGLLQEAIRTNPTGRFKLARIEKFDFPPDQDAIIAFASLLHLNKHAVDGALRKADTALSPNGVFFISTQLGEYRRETREESTGKRTYYLYTPDMLVDMAPRRLVEVFRDTQHIKGKDWFTLILQKY